MKEIKFRAWDKDFETMSRELDLSVIHYFLTDAIVMQYIGLKDKNGVEIYEGDIVKNGTYRKKPDAEDTDCLYEVYYSESSYKYKSLQNVMYMQFSANECEVIGNIYENPELLRGVE